METIHVTFDELTEQAAPVHSSSGPAPNLLTPGPISSGLIPNSAPAIPYVPPTNKDLELLFQPMFDEYFETPTGDHPMPLVPAAPTAAIPTGPSVFISFDHDAPSGSHSPSSLAHQSSLVHHGVATEHSFEVNPFAATENEPFVNVFAPDLNSEASSSGLATDALCHKFDRLDVWELVPPPDCAMISLRGSAIWDNVKMLLAGSELIKEDKESQLYDEFERFKMLPGENINEYYVRFHKLVNDMRNIRMTIPNIQLNFKFVNNMSPEWDRFVTAVKLNKGLKETNHEQLYAYLKQHEKHAAQDRLIIERITPATNDQLAFVSTVQPHAQSSHVQSHQYPSSSTNPQSLQYPQFPETSQIDSGYTQTDEILDNLTKQMALLAQSFRATLPQTNNQLRTSSNTRNQATIQDGRVVVQNVQGQWGEQNRAGNANAGQGKPVKCYNCNRVGHIARNFLDEEELLFLAGEQGNTFDADVDNQPVQDLALNEDNIFQADECDAFDSIVDDEPTTQTIFMANLSSTGSANPQAGPSNASILSEVHTLENAIDHSVTNQDEHEIHNEVQQSNVIDSTSVYMGNSNVIPYEQYLSVNNISVVPSCASSTLNNVCVSSDNDAFVPHDPIANELKIYKEQVAIYEQRAKCPEPFSPQTSQPALYDGEELLKTHHVPVNVPSSEEELELAEATRNKLHVKMNDSACVEKRVNITPPNYSKENFMATFTPQTQLTPEQVFWSIDLEKRKAEELKANAPPLPVLPPATVYPPNTPVHLVPRTLPTTSQVNIGLYVITQLFWDFEKTCKKRITPTGITEGERGFEQTKRCYLTEVIPFFNLLKEHFDGVQKSLVTEVRAMKAVFENLEAEVDQNEIDLKSGEIERKNLLITNENLIAECLSKDVFYTATDSVLNVSRFSDMHDAFTIAQKRIADLESENFNLRNKIQNDDHDSMIKHFSKLEVEHFNLQLKYQNLKERFGNKKPVTSSDAPSFDSLFVIGKLNEQIQSRGNTIRELKEKISRLTKKNSDADPIFDLKALVSQNKDLTAKLNALHDLNERFRAENAKVKQHYKELYDSIKITRAKTTDQNNSLLSEIENLKAQLKDNSKCVTIPDSKPKVLAPGRYPIDVYTVKLMLSSQATSPSPQNKRDIKDRNIGKLLNGRFSHTGNDKEGDLWIMGYRSQVRRSAQSERKRSGKVEGVLRNLRIVASATFDPFVDNLSFVRLLAGPAAFKEAPPGKRVESSFDRYDNEEVALRSSIQGSRSRRADSLCPKKRIVQLWRGIGLYPDDRLKKKAMCTLPFLESVYLWMGLRSRKMVSKIVARVSVPKSIRGGHVQDPFQPGCSIKGLSQKPKRMIELKPCLPRENERSTAKDLD
ncbi:integrase, catalytic region, zinc finger, CCHC-type containing protein [Tanacetum coccineum]